MFTVDPIWIRRVDHDRSDARPEVYSWAVGACPCLVFSSELLADSSLHCSFTGMASPRRSRGAGSRSTPAIGVSSILESIAQARSQTPSSALSSLLGKHPRDDENGSQAEEDHDSTGGEDNQNCNGPHPAGDGDSTGDPPDVFSESPARAPFVAKHNIEEFAQAHASKCELTAEQIQDVVAFSTVRIGRHLRAVQSVCKIFTGFGPSSSNQNLHSCSRYAKQTDSLG